MPPAARGHDECGRYTRPITPVENRICSNCNSKSVEDEIHFLMYCPKFENLRRELFSNVLNYNAARSLWLLVRKRLRMFLWLIFLISEI
jgi:hypothetical protein